MNTKCLVSLTLLSLLPMYALGRSNKQSVRLEDSSDWWSVLNEHFESSLKPTPKEIPVSNFEIGGATLNAKVTDALSEIEPAFGPAQIVERGDASTGREQICYKSSSGPTTYLIFEQGELELDFYLIQGGESWSGQGLCAVSNRVTPALQTKSGLKLGLSQAATQRILGPPDSSDTSKIVYRRGGRKKASDEDLAYSRKQHPEMSDKEIHENFDFYYLDIYIEARFTNDRLTYLAVSKAETD